MNAYSPSIVAFKATKCQHKSTKVPRTYSFENGCDRINPNTNPIAWGENYEDLLVFYLRLNGFDAIRPKLRLPGNNDPMFYKKHQEDIQIFHPDGSHLTIDVKSRESRTFSFNT